MAIPLRETIERWLQEEIFSKPEDERTKRDEAIIAAAATLATLLRRHEARNADQDAPRHSVDTSIIGVLNSYVEINREYDLQATDLVLADRFRGGRRGGK